MDTPRPNRRFRFGVFELDADVPELLKSGRRVRIRPQSLKLLALLVERKGELVLRSDIETVLWGTDTFIDFEQGVNHSIKQIRAALGDSADSPRFVETLPRRGYRFVADVEAVETRVAASGLAPMPIPIAPAAQPRFRGLRRGPAILVSALAAVLVGVGIYAALAGRGGTASVAPLIVIRPFSTAGSDPSVGVGLADVIAARLGGQHIAVRPAVGGPDTASHENEPNTFVLSGDVVRNGSDVTVSTRLSASGAATAVWSERFSVRASELFSVEDVVAERVVNALALRVAAREQARLRRRYTRDAAAYDHYLRGRAAMVAYTPAGTRQAIDAFETSLRHDPAYALARAGLAMACADMYLRFAPASEVESWGRCAENESRTALDADPDLAEAHLARAAVARKREFDWPVAVVESQRALVLNPNLDQAHFFVAAAYYHLGYMDEAAIELERGRRLRGQDVVEPLRIEALIGLFSGNFAPARVHLEEVSRRSSQAIGDTYLALALFYSGSIDRSVEMLETLASSSSASTAARAGAALAAVHAARGNRADGRAALDRVLAQAYRDHHVAYGLGTAYAQLGDAREAARWLSTAADTGFPCLVFFERDPLLASIRREPAFADVISRVRAQRAATAARMKPGGA